MKFTLSQARVFKSFKFGCLCAFIAAAVSAAVAAVLLSLYVPGAWREKPPLENPADIAILFMGAVGFLIGFWSEARRK